MATLTITPTRFRPSPSSMQSTDSVGVTSLADWPQKIDIDFEKLRHDIGISKERLTDYVKRIDTKAQQEKNEFMRKITALEGRQRKERQRIKEEESKLAEQADKAAKAEQESNEMNAAIRTLNAEKEMHASRQDHIKREIAIAQSAIKSRREAQARHQQSLDAQARQNIPELRFWETCLGMRIEGTGVDEQLRFVFSCIDEDDEERECWFDLDMGGKDYGVVNTKPRLERFHVEGVLDRLNETKELDAFFLRDMRALFAAAIKS